MIKRLGGLLYGSIPAEFKSAFGLAESAERLRAATRRSAFGVLAQQAATGPVSETRVRLQRVIPLIGNSFKPFFFGRFEVRSDAVYLTGRFTMLPFVKVFMTVWLGGVAFGIVAAAAQLAILQAVLPALGMFAAGIALVGLGKWFARNDVAWLSNVIQEALGAPATALASLSPAPATSPSTVTAAPVVLRITALVLIFVAVMSVWSAVSGISSWHASPGEKPAVTYFSSPSLRLSIGAFGVAIGALAVGVYRRRMWAWWGTLALIVASGLTAVPHVFTDSNFPGSTPIRVIFGIASLAVTFYWGWWWYAQRIHFISDAGLLGKQ